MPSSAFDVDEFLAELDNLDQNAANTAVHRPPSVNVLAAGVDGYGTPMVVHSDKQANESLPSSLVPVSMTDLSIGLSSKEALEDFLDPKHSFSELIDRKEAIVPRNFDASCVVTGTRRTLPLSKPRGKYLPSAENMILTPFALRYELNPVKQNSRGASAYSSSSMYRQTAGVQNYTRGASGNVPFRPGGMRNKTEYEEELEAENQEFQQWKTKRDKFRTLEDCDLSMEALEDDICDESIKKLQRVTVPGFSRQLTDEELNGWRQQRESESDHDEQVQGVALQRLGVNPPDLLTEYTVKAQDEDYVRHISSFVGNVPVKDTKQGELALEKLLDSLDGDDSDDELFYEEKKDGDKDEDEDEEGKESLSATELVSSFDSLEMSLEKKTANAKDDVNHNDDKDDDNDDDDVTVEVDSLLSLETELKKLDLHNENLGAKSTKKGPVLSEWTVTDRIDTSSFHEEIPVKAIDHPFELDTFQKEAVLHMEHNECIFVAAHTSAGKTVVAEYAIALSQKHLTRAVYTSPIKALSNQKFREFKDKFGEDKVGLITGDVSINPDATCLVMTTEILRSMLYKGADMIRDIEWVIFDEIHYINDLERGVVWEEVIIMLPDHVHMVFLSATTPNTYEFSDWIGRTKQKRIHVITTAKRPVPLEHFIITNTLEMEKIMTSDGVFLTNGYNKLTRALEDKKNMKTANARGRGRGRSGASGPKHRTGRAGAGGGDRGQWMKFARKLQSEDMLPTVAFAFSKRLCEDSAYRLSTLDLSTQSEKSEIHVFVEHSILKLSAPDRGLPQVLQMKERLLRGVGVHHGGLLPILKEIVEILFSRGLVKILFSTETFAMGVNMPARTVVFNGIHKHDGRSFRDLLPGEYTQMAGRAGRRGLDNVGIVIIAAFGELPDVASVHTMLGGKATKLSSQFRLTYNMILNLLRVEDMSVEDMMKRSFSEFHTQKALSTKNIPKLIHKSKKIINALEKEQVVEYQCIKGGDAVINKYYELKKEADQTARFITARVLEQINVQTVLFPGRIVQLSTVALREVKAMILQCSSTDLFTLILRPKNYNHEKRNAVKKRPSNRSLADDPFFLGTARRGSGRDLKYIKSGDSGQLAGKEYLVLQLSHSGIELIYDNCKKPFFNHRKIMDESCEQELCTAVEHLAEFEAKYNSFSTSPPLVNPMKDFNLRSLELNEAMEYRTLMSVQSSSLKCEQCPIVSSSLKKTKRLKELTEHTAKLQHAVSSNSLSLFTDFQDRLVVLELLGYIHADKTVQLKGRVACEINTSDELVVTELLFENVLADLCAEEAVAVLSCLVFQEKTDDEPSLTPRLAQCKTRMQDILQSLAVLQIEKKLQIDAREYSKTLNFGLMEVCYEWARGMPFKQICELTTVQEGSIVRCITRLNELCREVRNAARVIGDPRLYTKMEMASECIKRDVVFASSLYLS